MSVNNQIRQAIIDDLKPTLGSGYTYFNGLPQSIEVGVDSDSETQLPAVAVFIEEGEVTDADFESEEWAGVLHVQLFDVAANDIEPVLDAVAEQVLTVIDRHYTAQGLLSNCSRNGFSYSKDEDLPWGVLDLTFIITWETE